MQWTGLFARRHPHCIVRGNMAQRGPCNWNSKITLYLCRTREYQGRIYPRFNRNFKDSKILARCEFAVEFFLRGMYSKIMIKKWVVKILQNYLFVKTNKFGHLYVKKIRNTAAIPRRGTEDAAGYDIASAEETVVPAKGKTVVKTGISIGSTRWLLWTTCPEIRTCSKEIYRRRCWCNRRCL